MIAWFQCAAGASGDMLLGALIDAGAPLEVVQAAVDAVGVEPIQVEVEPVLRHGLAALKAHVRVRPSTIVRTWANVRGLLEAADLAEPVRARALDVFARLAQAEGTAHRTSPDSVHFHEVGALDAIADVVGVCAALHALGVTEAACSGIAVGSGMVRAAHGLLPVPGPAVVELLTEAGAPIYSGDEPFELCTPTGAALLAGTVTQWGGLPLGRLVASGTGAGTRQLESVPNVLRVLLLQPAEPAEVVADEGALDDATGSVTDELLIETNVDDLDPRVWPDVLSRLMAAGAVDAWLTPILMKKGRPAHTLSALVPLGAAAAVRSVVFTQTPALGLREQVVRKHALGRQWVSVDVHGQPVRIKQGTFEGRVVSAQPEYEDVLAAADATGRPVKSVLADAVAAARAAGLTP